MLNTRYNGRLFSRSSLLLLDGQQNDDKIGIEKERYSTISQLLPPDIQSHHDAVIGVDGQRQRTATFSSATSYVRRRFSGWRAGLVLAISADAVVVLLTLVLTFTAAFGFQRDGDDAILVNQGCGGTKHWSVWLHLLINILSTIMLSTSSYTMQCLGSPTRSEINIAHAEGKWLNIGVPSLSNLFRVKKTRRILYIGLVVTSLPLHLLANSIVYETQGANSYLVSVVDPKFVSTPLSDLHTGYAYHVTGFDSPENVIRGNQTEGSPHNSISLGWNFTETLKNLVPTMDHLDNRQCIEAYSDPFSPTRGNVIAVASQNFINVNNTNYINQLYYQSVDFCPDCQTYRNWSNPSAWTCAFTSPSKNTPVISCNAQAAASQADSFSIEDIDIGYCLSEKVAEHCQLRASIPLMVVVVICAFVKTLLIFLVLKTMPTEILATIGDAIASFLNSPESRTEGACLLTRGDVQNHRWTPGAHFPKHWTPDSSTAIWARGPRIFVWARTIPIMLSILVVAIVLLAIGLTHFRNIQTGLNTYSNSDGAPPTDIASLWRLGFGTANVNLMLQLPDMSSSGNVVAHVLLVNTPQLILSLVYFSYNTVWTNMLVAHEWAQFGRSRRSLRVSVPAGEQRMQFTLSIPWKFAIPLQSSSVLLHWLLSQSFFLARINVYPARPFVGTPPAVINTVGYSLISLVFLIISWASLFFALIGFGWTRKLKSPMPIVGGNSFAISAACHVPKTESCTALQPLTWGVVDAMEGEDGVKHCCFTAGDSCSPAMLERRKSTRFGRKLEDSVALFV